MIKHFPHDKPRPVQIEALTRIEDALEREGKRTFVLDAPTGCGKTAIAFAVSRYYGTAFITSPQNMLVDQYVRDYRSLQVVKGKANYTCAAFPFRKYPRQTDCSCRDRRACNCPALRDCETADDLDGETHKDACVNYIPARNAFWRGPIGCTNLDYLYWAPSPEGLTGAEPHRRLLVIDECHNLEEKLISLGRVQITTSNCARLGLAPSHFRMVQRKDYEAAAARLEEFRTAVFTKSKMLGVKEARVLNRKSEAIGLTLTSGDWMFWTDERNNFVVCPLSAQRQADKLLSCADKLLFMSATIGGMEPFLEGLGLSADHAAGWGADNSVAVERRTVSYQPVGNMSYKSYETALPDITKACRQVLDYHKDQKGLILCASYALQTDLARGLQQFANRLLVHTAVDREDAIERHCKSSEPTVLLGVAMTEGLDLKYDRARFLIIPKVPYPSLADPYIQARKELNERWYARQTALAIVQGAGRVVRGDDDHADIYVFDSSFRWFLKNNEALFPQWFLEAIEVKKKRPYGDRRAGPRSERA